MNDDHHEVPATAASTEVPAAAGVPVFADRNGLVVLSHTECLAALATHSLGRVAVTDRAMPVILPVNYGLLDGDIVFATAPGSKLDAAVVRSIVAFEVDEVDERAGTGWSVCVTGVAEELVQQHDIDRAERLGLHTMLPGPRHRHVRIRSDLVSGRRVP